MTAPLALLGMLSAASRVIGRITGPPPGPVTGKAGFDDLLERARMGDLSSGLGVEMPDDADVELTDEQAMRLASAVDRAQAQGADTALVLIDGMALRVDVESRTVLERVDGQSSTVMDGIDVVVTAAGPGEQAPSDQLLANLRVTNPSVHEVRSAAESGQAA